MKKKKCRISKCCCKCGQSYEATVCNCFSEWNGVIIKQNEINSRHGTIGYGCLVFLNEGKIDVRRKEHRAGCECWEKRGGK